MGFKFINDKLSCKRFFNRVKILMLSRTLNESRKILWFRLTFTLALFGCNIYANIINLIALYNEKDLRICINKSLNTLEVRRNSWNELITYFSSPWCLLTGLWRRVTGDFWKKFLSLNLFFLTGNFFASEPTQVKTHQFNLASTILARLLKLAHWSICNRIHSTMFCTLCV